MVDAGSLHRVELAFEVDQFLGPELVEQLDLFLEAPSPGAEILAESLELNLVPAHPHPQGEPLARQKVQGGGLLGHQRGLPLGEHQHPQPQFDPGGDPGHVPEQHEGLVKAVLVGVGPGEHVPGGVRPQDVFVDEDRVETQPFGGLGPGANRAPVRSDLDLGEYRPYVHDAPFLTLGGQVHVPQIPFEDLS